MSIGKREIAILTGLAKQIEEYATQVGDARTDYSHYRKVQFAKDSMAAVNPVEWTGQTTTASRSVMNGRSYKRLEAAGWVERLNLGYGQQTTHLRLTKEGQAAAGLAVADEAIPPAGQ